VFGDRPARASNLHGVSPRFGYPVTLDLHGVPVLVVGAGPIAARKVNGLAAAGAIVHVVATHVSGEMDREVNAGHVTRLDSRPYVRTDLDGVRLVVAATALPEVDSVIAADAAAAGIWVNAVDQPADSTFILPAIARNGPLTIAVSTDGASPALAQRLRDHAAALLTSDVAGLGERLATRRRQIQAAGGTTEDHRAELNEAIDAVLGPRPGPASD
jgi:precorrin-2 dehydrogenase / sirohydrochlorin ferrochelatase